MVQYNKQPFPLQNVPGPEYGERMAGRALSVEEGQGDTQLGQGFTCSGRAASSHQGLCSTYVLEDLDPPGLVLVLLPLYIPRVAADPPAGQAQHSDGGTDKVEGTEEQQSQT